MKRTRFFFSGLALVGLTIGSLLVDRALAQTPQPTTGTCAVPDYSNDPRFTCPTTATCYGPGTGTCQDGTGRNFAYVQQTASKYSQCKPPIVSTDSCGVLVFAALHQHRLSQQERGRDMHWHPDLHLHRDAARV